MTLRRLLLAAACGPALIAAPALAAEAPPPTDVDQLVVTAAPYAVSIDSTTTSIDVLGREELDRAPPVGLGDLLEGLPGLRSTFYGPGASRPVIRGLSGPRVLILQNGVGLVDASSVSPDHAVASEPGEANRIEILRGPSTLAYGGSAIGGVVNILDDRVPSRPAEGGLEGRIAASAGAVDDSRSVSVGLKAGSGPWVVALDAVSRDSGDYEVPVNPVSDRLAAATGETPLTDRVVRNSDVSLDAYGVGVSYVGADGYIGASVKRTQTQYGVPYPQIVQVGPPPAEGPVYIDLEQTRWDLRGETAIDLGVFDKARFSVGYADYEHAEIEVAGGAVGTRFLSDGVEGRLELVQRQRNGWKGAFGVQGLTRSFEAIGDEAFIPPVDIEEVGAFLLQRLDRDAWGLEGGLRLDRRSLSADLAGRPTSGAAAAYGLDWSTAAPTQEFTNASASIAAFWRPADGWFLSLALSGNSRAPTEFELFADGPHAGTGSYEIGDPTLDPEKVVSVEGTIRWTGAATKAEVHLYTARYDGFIQDIPTGDLAEDDGTLDPAGELPVFRFVQSDATFSGVEFEATHEIWREGDRSLSFEGVFDHVRGKTDVGPPARIPSWSATARLLGEWGAFDWTAEVRRVGEQDRVAAFELPTNGYTLVGLQVGWRPFDDSDLKLFVDGRNLTDAEAREHTSFLKDIAPLPGRNVRFGLSWAF
ncbi:MAG TPA: TonB-dependent receptor [Caulobacter sp.]|nr:TonB-dependent receptor [Caulobacter sp.]